MLRSHAVLAMSTGVSAASEGGFPELSHGGHQLSTGVSAASEGGFPTAGVLRRCCISERSLERARRWLATLLAMLAEDGGMADGSDALSRPLACAIAMRAGLPLALKRSAPGTPA
jgi:hypothetical protein